MPEDGDRRKPELPRGAGKARYALPDDLAGSLRYLDEGQLDRLLRAVIDEARRRERLGNDEQPSAARAESKDAAVRKRAARVKATERPAPVSAGMARVIQAAYDAGVKPGTIAREFRISRVQVERLVARPSQGER